MGNSDLFTFLSFRKKSMDQEIEVSVGMVNDSQDSKSRQVAQSFLIHIPMDCDEHQEIITSEHIIKEEHLDPIQPTQFAYNDDDQLNEELEIVKLERKCKKRVSLTIEKKIEIIKRHESGETQRALSQEYNVGRTTVSDILKVISWTAI